ncbi:MAG TPA: hypothetical protein VM888_09995 [Chitinophagaceae bacterium]|jgi:hypothetical protein|nr:hypothetical protein [Chitinophagaceae bacterium]
MEFTSVVLYDGGLAHYNVSTIDGKAFYAYLLHFSGDEQNSPPKHFEGTKLGRHWVGNTDREDLLEDLGYDVSLHFKVTRN